MIDAHLNLWQLGRGDYVWPNESVAPIFGDLGPDDLLPLLHEVGVRQTILVQASDTLAETVWLLDIARRCDAVAGVVGWVDLAGDDAVATIDRILVEPRLKGLRPMLQGIAETDWILRPELTPVLAHMAGVGLAFDALIQPRHLPSIAELARRHPTLRIVVDHIAKPSMGMVAGPWRNGPGNGGAGRLRKRLVQAFRHGHRDRSQLAPAESGTLRRDRARRFQAGAHGVGIGLASGRSGGRLRDLVRSARELAAGLDDRGRARLFGGTAREFYRLDEERSATQGWTRKDGPC